MNWRELAQSVVGGVWIGVKRGGQMSRVKASDKFGVRVWHWRRLLRSVNAEAETILKFIVITPLKTSRNAPVGVRVAK